jgi:hypothetical protein
MAGVSDPSSQLPEVPELGPPPRSSAEWLFTRRPGRSLDAANVRLVDKSPHRAPIRRRKALRGTLTSIVGIAIAILVALQTGFHL